MIKFTVTSVIITFKLTNSKSIQRLAPSMKNLSTYSIIGCFSSPLLDKHEVFIFRYLISLSEFASPLHHVNDKVLFLILRGGNDQENSCVCLQRFIVRLGAFLWRKKENREFKASLGCMTHTK